MQRIWKIQTSTNTQRRWLSVHDANSVLMRCHCLQVTHTVIVLSPTLVACHHFSTCLLYLSSFFPSSAQLSRPLLSCPPCPQCCSLPQRAKPELCSGSSLLGCFSGLAALTPEVLLVLYTSWKTRKQLAFSLWYYLSEHICGFHFFFPFHYGHYYQQRVDTYRFYSWVKFFL